MKVLRRSLASLAFGAVVFLRPPHSAGVVGVGKFVASALRSGHVSVIDPIVEAPILFGDPYVANSARVVM
jgi:hypothetical protein